MVRPPWLKKKFKISEIAGLNRMLDRLKLNTICQEAHCPNISECFKAKQATFLILGKICTRRCSFCNVSKETPLPPDENEPDRIAQAVKELVLRHVVITSPTRDDLPDGGAHAFIKTTEKIKKINPDTTIELLVPDFKGNQSSIYQVAGAGAEIIAHNMETVQRLYDIRKGADYNLSLDVLRTISNSPSIRSKTGIMLGLGEKEEDILALFQDILDTGCKLLSIGQYLAPSLLHHPVMEYVKPEIFQKYREKALSMGFAYVESGPYVRSSYHAGNYLSEN